MSTNLLCVVLHDVSPSTWDDCERLVETLARVDGARPVVTRLVVPAFHRGPPALGDERFARRLDRARRHGDELVLHGWRHLDEAPLRGPLDRFRRTVLTDREGEFSALGTDESERRLRDGLAWFASHGWPTEGFVAPAWQMSADTRAVLERSPLRWTSTLSTLVPLHGGAPLHAPCLTASPRSAPRRALSELLIRLRARHLARSGERGPRIVRLGLHPDDAHHPRLRAAWADAYARLRESGRQAVTKSEALQRIQIDTRPTTVPSTAPASTSLG